MVFTCIADFVCLRCPRYIADPLMQVDNLRKVSVACTSLCMWVHAIDKYTRISRDVVPKQRRLVDMNAALATANDHLAIKQVRHSGFVLNCCKWHSVLFCGL